MEMYYNKKLWPSALKQEIQNRNQNQRNVDQFKRVNFFFPLFLSAQNWRCMERAISAEAIGSQKHISVMQRVP
jgi:hypothetical protein